MSHMSAFAEARSYRPADWAGPDYLPAAFRSIRDDYAAAVDAAVLVDRSDRVLLVLRGRDRSAWLHNLVTQAVKPLAPGAGAYAFACDVRGRIQFDLNILALADELWVDLAGESAEAASAHFDRYQITEDVQIARSEDYARLAVSGPQAAAWAARLLSVPDLADWAPLQHRSLTALPPGAPGSGQANAAALPPRIIRHDLFGDPGFELFLPRSAAGAWWDWLVECGLSPAGGAAMEVRRIEAGVPRLTPDLAGVVAPESGQAQRAIHYQKGCYLGQEVIERMRSHSVQARRLVRLELADGAGLTPPLPLRADGREAGLLTSLARHPIRPAWVALGYLRSSLATPAELICGEPSRPIRAL